MHARSGRRQCSGRLVDAENDRIAARLIRHQHVLPRRLDGEVARCLDAHALVADRLQFARVRVDRENCDRVVRVAVGDVDEFARWMYDCLCGAASLANDIVGQRGQHLRLRQEALVRVVGTSDDRQV